MLTEAIAHERIGHLSDFAGKRVERWWVDALFLALDRLIEDRELDGERVSPERYGSLLGRSSFAQIAGARGSVRNFVCGRAAEHYAAMALMKRSPKMTANCALAMVHSRGGILHSFSDRFKIR